MANYLLSVTFLPLFIFVKFTSFVITLYKLVSHWMTCTLKQLFLWIQEVHHCTYNIKRSFPFVFSSAHFTLIHKNCLRHVQIQSSRPFLPHEGNYLTIFTQISRPMFMSLQISCTLSSLIFQFNLLDRIGKYIHIGPVLTLKNTLLLACGVSLRVVWASEQMTNVPFNSSYLMGFRNTGAFCFLC